MENARILDERLKKIVRDISSKTGHNIKLDLIQDLEERLNKMLNQQSEKKLNQLLIAFKKNLDEL
ncbi:hypothetical protein Dtox_1732 [Desulfofarcimen acetoxidans DSM 771]|uniref:Uncharacterized protein n=1 Tax=Desulfofarcimen acetoxidans (strain ATCC 49208 / DSM 771 / KCTC 5769 / VKM B-1644 / 5575) TaxID=485916 RepID=C8VX13_DESAS|nr:hypothetical protein [Desulfofarcimen acetoxidans]ACV62589.1 hypothetical protein Dtox_1732 [Desulfofarcimen acetoxidans DSM 771]